MKFWTLLGKAKQVFAQMTLYFSVVSITGILITAWHTTISPTLESHGITPSLWWLVLGLGIPLLVLGFIEWTKGTSGYFRSFMKFIYTDDSELKKDIDELKRDIKTLIKKEEK